MPINKRIFIYIVTCLCISSTPVCAEKISGVASVIDGDTLEIHGKRIRLHGIDAPESRQICTINDRAWRCGRSSAFALSNFVGRKPVTCESHKQDRYKRFVAVCTLGDIELNAWMVKQGLALDWPKYSRGDYAALQTTASEQNKGIWASEFEPPWEWRKKNKK